MDYQTAIALLSSKRNSMLRRYGDRPNSGTEGFAAALDLAILALTEKAADHPTATDPQNKGPNPSNQKE